jgi:hypothetical protein
VLTIIHIEGEGAEQRIIHDLIKEYGGRGHKIDLAGMVREMASILGRYGLQRVVGDKYAAGWTRQRFEAEGVAYDDAPKSKAEAYLEAEPFFATARIEILDHPELVRELKQLERRSRAGGRTIVDHPHGGHDDFSNCLCLAVAVAVGEGADGYSLAGLDILNRDDEKQPDRGTALILDTVAARAASMVGQIHNNNGGTTMDQVQRWVRDQYIPAMTGADGSARRGGGRSRGSARRERRRDHEVGTRNGRALN